MILGLILLLLAPSRSNQRRLLIRVRELEVIDHWYSLADDFSLTPTEFYEAMEKELATRKVPELTVERIELFESTLLSARRLYLRLTREDLVFDLCAAPFGTAYFFSIRYGQRRAELSLLGLAVLSCTILMSFWLFFKLLGLGAALMLCLLSGAAVASLARAGWPPLEQTLQASALLAGLHQRLCRPLTYHRIDTGLMYQRTIQAAFKTLVDKFTAAGGVKLLREYQRAAPASQLYHAGLSSPTGRVSTKPTATNVPA